MWQPETWAWQQRGLRPVERLLLIVLARLSVQHGWARVSQKYLCADLEISESSLRRAMASLEDRKLIERKANPDVRGGRFPDTIILHRDGRRDNLDELDALADEWDRQKHAEMPLKPAEMAEPVKMTPPPLQNDRFVIEENTLLDTTDLFPDNSLRSLSGPQTVDPVKVFFDETIALLARYGIAERKARTLAGKWRKAAEIDRLTELIRDAGSKERHNIVEFIEGALKHDTTDQTRAEQDQRIIDRLKARGTVAH